MPKRSRKATSIRRTRNSGRTSGRAGVIESSADGKIEDTGALNTKRMETVDASSSLPRRISSNAKRRPTSRSSGDKDFKVHLDGYNLTELKGEAKEPPREAVYYFDQGGNLNAIRWNDWKLSFAINSEGNIATATRETPSWANITNLRMDPYERGAKEGGGAMEFIGRNMWLLVPIQGKIKEFFQDFDQYPYQPGSTLNASGISYTWLQQQAALKRLGELGELESLAPR